MNLSEMCRKKLRKDDGLFSAIPAAGKTGKKPLTNSLKSSVLRKQLNIRYFLPF